MEAKKRFLGRGEGKVEGNGDVGVKCFLKLYDGALVIHFIDVSFLVIDESVVFDCGEGVK